MQAKQKSLLATIMTRLMFVVLFVALSWFFSQGAHIHGVELAPEYFSGPMPSILGLLNSELFMGVISVVTLFIIIYVIKLLWDLHEVATHKAMAAESAQTTLVFALSLCGLFINKTWWVLAIVIAFTRWDIISQQISDMISQGIRKGNNNDEVSK
ncbi:hypothetical protein SIN8267_00817 [Sinobacterium norvegicum]|uniref:Magnesium transporter n=1 Tax=Sinobacterium norvegicum TaxID=1641715 RepID=A0ABN8EEI2_9GAMM|nr:hypothetical protein [Sinobacterium norvegicum]CAH0990722.1 hypothetical protein SIN8267_00817 [Sinobacterium norvegicum]